MGTLYTKVAGVTFDNEDGTNRQHLLGAMVKSDKIWLRDEASDKYPEAIAVYDDYDNRLGFLPSDVAEHVRECGIIDIDSISARIDSIGSDPGKPLGMRIVLSDPDLVDMYSSSHVSTNRNTGSSFVGTYPSYQSYSTTNSGVGSLLASAKARQDQAEREKANRKSSFLVWLIMLLITGIVVGPILFVLFKVFGFIHAI